jgi:hypothetical protein
VRCASAAALAAATANGSSVKSGTSRPFAGNSA